LVLILVPLWVIGFGLGVKAVLEGGGFAFVGLSLADAESYPALTGEFTGESNPIDAGLLPGDVLLRVGDADLRGTGSLRFMVLSHQEAGPDPRVPVVYQREGREREASLPLITFDASFLPWLASSFAWAASALFLLLRARPTPSVRALFHAGFCLAFVLCLFSVGYAQFWAQAFAQALVAPLLLRFIALFPDDRHPAGSWSRVWPWFFALPGPVWAAVVVTGRWTIGLPLYAGAIGLGAIALLTAFTRKYRGGDPVARRQIRWVVIGSYCSALPLALAGALAAIDLRFSSLFLASFWALPLFPAFLLVSIARFNLYDVDRILSATASYNILAVLLGGGALIVVPRLAEAVAGVAGLDPGISQIAISLALAAVLIPAHQRLQPQIERLFFKERHALDHGIAELLPALSTCSDMRQLTGRVGSGLHDLIRPEACVVYAAVDHGYVPVFVEGRAVPPAFDADSPLVDTLRGRRAALSLSSVGRRPDEAPLGAFDRAALEGLRAEAVVPVRQGNTLVAFLCLGPKRSGDVYTSTDLFLLMAVAEATSRELHRFDQDEVIREGREMQESLRRYVPGAVVEQLSSGAELISGEREVSVLFVDIRGYTGFAENRSAEDVFSTVNRYTETVSRIVQKHAGSVVEFNGDGMMAVFGAPRELVHKERAAVEAGRAILVGVGSMPVEPGQGEIANLSVGVGIATGEAFVGNIQAVDRMIWSAIGNTTNLAARLQSLTRNLDSSLVIDRRTWERAQAAAADFEPRRDVPIRGRRETQDVYTLSTSAR
jgi:class 3 adenylate cyclase